MKLISFASGLLLTFGLVAFAQVPGMPGVAPGATPSFSKLFGDHKAFSADTTLEVTQGAEGGTFTIPGKIAYLEGKSRMDVDVSRSQGPQLPAGMAEQLKSMGMGEMTVIADESTNTSYFVYPGLKAYAALAPEGAKTADPSKVKMTSTELGKDTVDGQACVKNKVVLTDPDGKTTEATVWNATDLKKFPVRIETADKAAKVRMTFKNVKFSKPDAKSFEPPENFTRHTSIQGLMGEAMKKMLGTGGGTLPGQ